MESRSRTDLVKEFLGKRVRVVYRDGDMISYFTGVLNKFDDTFVYGTDKFNLTVAIGLKQIDKISEIKKDGSKN